MNKNKMLSRRLQNDVAIVGIGGAGTNIAFCLEKLAYTTIHINSSAQDESAIKGAKNIRHLKGFNGCAGDRLLAEKALAENMDIVDEIINLEQSIIFVIFSSAGGTGSGVGAALIDMLVEETDKTICAIVVLPDKSEDFDFHVNSYKCCQELLEIENMGSVMFLDNNSGNKQRINSICTTMLNAFLSDNSVSELGNVDEQEKRTILGTHGSMVLSVLGNEKASAEKVIEMLTTNNIFAPLQNDSKCEYIGIINSTKKIDKKEIIKVVGIPRRTFEGYGSDKTITAISGLSFPFDHLNSIKEIAKQKHDERINAAKAIQSNELEDLDFTDNVMAGKEEKQKPKKLSRREKLKMLNV